MLWNDHILSTSRALFCSKAKQRYEPSSCFAVHRTTFDSRHQLQISFHFQSSRACARGARVTSIHWKSGRLIVLNWVVTWKSHVPFDYVQVQYIRKRACVSHPGDEMDVVVLTVVARLPKRKKKLYVFWIYCRAWSKKTKKRMGLLPNSLSMEFSPLRLLFIVAILQVRRDLSAIFTAEKEPRPLLWNGG